MTSVLVVEDYEHWRNFHLNALQKRLDLQVIALVSDGLEAVQQAHELQPDLLLLDIGLPTLNGIEAARRIQIVSPLSKVLFVSESCSPEVIEEALNAGAVGFLAKSDAGRELMSAIEAVLEGNRFLSASLVSHDLGASGAGASDSRHLIQYNPYLQLGRSASFSKFLASAIEATAANFRTFQVFDFRESSLEDCGALWL